MNLRERSAMVAAREALLLGQVALGLTQPYASGRLHSAELGLAALLHPGVQDGAASAGEVPEGSGPAATPSLPHQEWSGGHEKSTTLPGTGGAATAGDESRDEGCDYERTPGCGSDHLIEDSDRSPGASLPSPGTTATECEATTPGPAAGSTSSQSAGPGQELERARDRLVGVALEAAWALRYAPLPARARVVVHQLVTAALACRRAQVDFEDRVDAWVGVLQVAAARDGKLAALGGDP